MLSANPPLPYEPAGGLTGWSADVVDTIGAPGAGLIVALENFFGPLPSEILLPMGGYAAAQGTMNLWSLIFWTTLGSVVGSLGLYWAGAKLGRDRLYRIWDRTPLLRTSDLERAEVWFAKHGRSAVAYGRVLPLLRALISVPAGVERMPLTIFVAMTALGSLVWNSLLIMTGYWMGDQWYRIEEYVGTFSRVFVLLLLLCVVALVVRRVLRNRAKRRQDATP
ncbi:DedA family protein [Streptomyces sp. 3MP-14]|uniref:DedA family protein n=1 Tax=Streptomyces mimosae TaxID=2586635 RepID=A0A5N6AEY4_9ACTN|nr:MULTISPECIES: DedA family protein [Streptomyces]KAB8166370.1 DedA family protein [Streptomyces mimosae]KAB8174163.1 DedA family protein [Streptomyces sp. 3MP-14]